MQTVADIEGPLKHRIAKLERENAKLRESLTELLRVDDAWHGAVNSEMAKARADARAALAGEGERE